MPRNLINELRDQYIDLLPGTPRKAPSDWQHYIVLCGDCGQESSCKVVIGEHLFCGKCGSEFVRKARRDG